MDLVKVVVKQFPRRKAIMESYFTAFMDYLAYRKKVWLKMMPQ